jgi:type IV secretory pathway VirB2 component (pilin)
MVETRRLSLKEMELVEGGSNLDNVMCAVSGIAWALGALTAPVGLGFALWVVGGVGAAYCAANMVNS